jgi:thiamine pyrophosphate-dependent acetolactate synthase large subunit-like protein
VKAQNGLARILKQEGVPFVVTFPTNGVNNALGEEGMPIIMMRDERYAAAVADAFSRVSNGKKVGVFTVMGGINAAGLQMAYGALAQAFEDGTPVLCITDGIGPATTGNTHYDMDQGLKSVTKYIGHINQAQRVPSFMQRAFTALRTGKGAPVMITIPRNLGEYEEAEHPYLPVKGWKWAPDPDDVKAAVKALLAAKKPLLYVGDGVFYADACAELLQFAEMAQVPVLTTLKGKSTFPENNPLSVGVRGEVASKFLSESDLVFGIGSSLSPARFSHTIPVGKTIVQCCIDASDINKGNTTNIAVIGDAKFTLKALIEELGKQTGGGKKKDAALLAEIAEAKKAFMEKYTPLLTSNDKPMNPYRIYGDMMKTLDMKNSFVSPDSGNTRDQTSTIWQSEVEHGFLGWGNVSTLGFGLAAAAGAKLAMPDRQCFNVSGDAGVGYMLGNFEPLIRHNIGVTTIHINNGGFSGYGPGFWGAGHDPYTCVVSDADTANMSKVLEGLGEHSERVTEPSEVIPALKRALDENAKGKPAYIEFICCQYPVMGRFLGAGF